MARPTKQGIDYFPLDTEFDDDLQLLIAEIGAEGLGILVTIWQAIYKGNGYYISSDKKFPLKIKQKCYSSVDKVTDVVGNAIDYVIFDRGLYEKYGILTSRGLQKRYFTAARNKKQVEIIPQYALIDISNIENAVDVVINEIDVVGNATKEEVEVKGEEKVYTPSSGKPNGACPHQDIIELYHTVLPELPQVRTWPESNQKILRTRWKEEPERQTISWWDAYFRYIHESAFLTGRETDFTADLEWVVRPKNMTKILNGRYHKQKHGGIMAWLTEMQQNSPE